MKKLIFTLLAVTAFCATGLAQSKSVVVYKNGVKMYEQHVSNVDSVVFKATPDTVKDIDGNVYRTITYTIKGKQVTWMIDNLRTTKYNDGTPIDHLIDLNSDYADGIVPPTGTTAPLRTTGCFCWHMNQPYNKEIFGGLYNHYAIETGKLAPKGWHVATNDEWKDLENTLATVDANNYDKTAVYDGTAEKVAKAMASQFTWSSSSNWRQIGNNPNSNNSSGFSLVACGYRSGTAWGSSMNNGYYWTATTLSQGTAEVRGNANSRGFTSTSQGLFGGTGTTPSNLVSQSQVNTSTHLFGVRCVKD